MAQPYTPAFRTGSFQHQLAKKLLLQVLPRELSEQLSETAASAESFHRSDRQLQENKLTRNTFQQLSLDTAQLHREDLAQGACQLPTTFAKKSLIDNLVFQNFFFATLAFQKTASEQLVENNLYKKQLEQEQLYQEQLLQAQL